MRKAYLEAAAKLDPNNQHLQFRADVCDLSQQERLVYFAMLAFSAKCSEGFLCDLSGLDRVVVRRAIELLEDRGLVLDEEDGYAPKRIIKEEQPSGDYASVLEICGVEEEEE